jgi:hypothetical protein
MLLNPYLKVLVTEEVGDSGNGVNLFWNHVVDTGSAT